MYAFIRIMTRFKISNCVYFHALLTVLLTTLLCKMTDGQDWPVISDPFPDLIGPEPPTTLPPTVDCTYACQPKIDEANGANW